MPYSDPEKSISSSHLEMKAADIQHKDDSMIDEGLGTVQEAEEHEVFARTEDGPDFRGVSCFGAAVLIAKSQFGLGVLSLPLTFQSLGFVPGLISLIVLSLVSTYTGIIVGKFRLSHPQVHSVGDATYLMFGKPGMELLGLASWLFYTLCYGASVLTVSIAFNTLTEHAACTMAWAGMAAGISFILGLLTRTMKVLSWCGYVGLASIFTSVWIVAIACLTQSSPAAAPAGEPVNRGIRAFPASSVPYSTIATAVATQLLSLCGTASFFTIHSEMKDQTKYVKSLLMGQGFVVFNYLVVSCIVFGKVGQYVTSPALGSAGPLFKKIAYGIALPGLFFSCFFQAHIAAKYALVRILRGTKHLQSNSLIHWGTWSAMMAIVIVIGFIVAGAIPFFNDLLGLIGALLGTSFTLIIPGFLALYVLAEQGDKPLVHTKGLRWLRSSTKNWFNSKGNMLIASVACFAILAGSYITVSGIYGSIVSIANQYNEGVVGSAFSCGDNSGS